MKNKSLRSVWLKKEWADISREAEKENVEKTKKAIGIRWDEENASILVTAFFLLKRTLDISSSSLYHFSEI
jgi:hypothetical protein